MLVECEVVLLLVMWLFGIDGKVKMSKLFGNVIMFGLMLDEIV